MTRSYSNGSFHQPLSFNVVVALGLVYKTHLAQCVQIMIFSWLINIVFSSVDKFSPPSCVFYYFWLFSLIPSRAQTLTLKHALRVYTPFALRELAFLSWYQSMRMGELTELYHWSCVSSRRCCFNIGYCCRFCCTRGVLQEEHMTWPK